MRKGRFWWGGCPGGGMVGGPGQDPVPALRIPVLLGPFLPALPWVRKTGTLVNLGGLLGCRAWLWHASLRHLVPLGAAGTWASSSKDRGGAAGGGWGGRLGVPGQHTTVPLCVLSSSDKEVPVGESEELASGNTPCERGCILKMQALPIQKEPSAPWARVCLGGWGWHRPHGTDEELRPSSPWDVTDAPSLCLSFPPVY